MDSRDATRQGQADDDDGLAMTLASGLAKEAASLFQCGRFADCVEVLNHILQKKKDDPKVLHNIAIAEFYRDGCSDPKSILDALKRVKKKSEDLLRASADESEVPPISNHMLNDSLNISSTNDVDTSIATVNTAIILFHLHEYGSAASLLEPLYQKLHPLDETTALNVCLLLIDIALASNNASAAAEVIQYLEKSFGDGQVMNQTDNQPSSQGSKINPSETNSVDSKTQESSLDRMLSEDAIEYETLLSSMDSGSQTLTKSTSAVIPAIPIDRPNPTASDLKLKIHLYRVRLLLLTRNLKAAKREVKLGMNVSPGRDSSIALLLKAQLESTRGNYRKAMKLLTTSNNRSDPALTSIFDNNLACIYHQLQKHHASLALFSKALKSSSSLLKLEREKEKPVKLLAFSQNKSPIISYNCGLQLLTTEKPLPAARCFHVAAPFLGGRPILWLRIAECCLIARSNPTTTARVIGSGTWRRLAVELPEDHRGYTLSLAFARQCLLNALILLDRIERKSIAGREGKVSIDASIAIYEGICKKERSLMRQVALADLAFVDLVLGNPLKALSSASELQKLPECSRIYSFFARVYAAEALVRLNRVREAVDLLSVYVSEGGGVDFPFKEEDLRVLDQEESAGGGSKLKLLLGPEEARLGLFLNMGLLSAVQGDLDRAKLFLGKALAVSPQDPRALLAGAYVDLRAGSTMDAVAKLKGCGHVRFVANGIPSAASR